VTRRLLRPLLVALGLALVAYLVYRLGPAAIWRSLETLSWRLLVVLCFPFSVATVLHTLGWHYAFRPPPRSFGRLLGARLAGEAVNLATPTASVGGEPVKAYLLRPGVPLPEGLASVVVDKTTVVVGQAVLLLVGVIVGGLVVPTPAGLLATMAGLLALEIVAVAGFVAVQLHGAVGRGGRLLSRFGVGPGADHQAKLEGLDRALRETYERQAGRLATSVLCHFLAFALGGVEIYLVVRFLGIAISFPVAFTIEAFSTGVKFISFMVPASLGALEGGNVAMFAAYGLGGAAGLSYTLVRRVREIAWTAVGFAALNLLSVRPLPPAEED
jgi:glycosyltransferase 2 family protein